MKKLNYALIAILLLSALLFFYKLGAPSVWDNDEGQLLGSAVEMLKSGEFLTPHLNSEVYFHKPPFMAWLTAFVFWLFGFSEFWGRFWAAVCGVGGIYVTYLFGKKLYSERVGLLSALVLATSGLYFALSRMALVDIMLCFFITLSLYLFYSGYKEPEKNGWFYGFYASMALGTMTKGPLGLVIPAISILIFLLLKKRLDFVLKMRPIKGLLIYLLIASPWFIIETVREGTYFIDIIFGLYLFNIYTKPLQQHPGPIYYYLAIVLLTMLPWSGFLISALFKKPQGLLLAWAGILFLIFSTAATKVPGYILPAFPALALITGKYLDEVLEGKNRKTFLAGLLVSAGLIALLIIAGNYVSIPAEYLGALATLKLLLYFMLAGALLALVFQFIRPIYSIYAWAGILTVFFLALITVFLPLAENNKYTKDFALRIEAGTKVGYYQTWLPPSFVYYLNAQSYPTVVKLLKDQRELRAFMRLGGKAYCLTSAPEARYLNYPVVMNKAGYTLLWTGQ